MKVLLCLCACIAAATAHGVVSYPVAPLGYHSTYLSPVLTSPFGVTYTGYPLPLVPNYVLYPGAPGFGIQYVPLVPPSGGKGKPGMKKPGGGKDDDKDTKKEETTEESKKEEESKADESEDLAQ